ncbi:hypothetical protein COCNU_09G007460 [Cocos nucifera]|uniref:Uncharacterized protein n=1 Tax=Cocos nucifera TaxID=13894 RepID=A0A8K0IKE3_COCNU|nr:hypothetical protein COCNU_09G007460 [Cocos nucifera]
MMGEGKALAPRRREAEEGAAADAAAGEAFHPESGFLETPVTRNRLMLMRRRAADDEKTAVRKKEGCLKGARQRDGIELGFISLIANGQRADGPLFEIELTTLVRLSAVSITTKARRVSIVF